MSLQSVAAEEFQEALDCGSVTMSTQLPMPSPRSRVRLQKLSGIFKSLAIP